MAKNYTFNEAVAIIAEGKDLEAITDIGRRYPVLAHKVAVVAAKAGEEFVELMGYMPDYITANKVNTAIKAGITGTGSADNADETEDEAAEVEATEDVAEDAGAPDYESMSAKQLWDILGKAGLRKTAKSTKKADLVEACKAMDAAKSETSNSDAEDEDADTTEATNPYEGKTAMELFKECKKRGIKATPKKAAKYYAELLVNDDAAKANETDAEDADDDWGDDDADTTAKEDKKPAKSAPTKKAKPAAKKAETKADDDDDWDI